MKKKILLFIALMLVLPTVVFAEKGNFEKGNFEILDFVEDKKGNFYSFDLDYKIDQPNKGDIYSIQLPFDVNIDGGNYLDIEYLGDSNYKLTVLDDFNYIKGNIKGKKTVYNTEDLKPIVIDGNVIKDDYPNFEKPNIDDNSTDRDRFYKLGSITGDIIDWEVTIGGDGKGVNATSITDDVGDGHKVVADSIKFYVIESGQYNNDLVDMIVKNLEVTDTEINFDIDTISPNEILIMEYQTEITDKNKKEFSNQLIIENEQKITQTVEIESDSSIEGEKDKEPSLPQVGESIFKIEYILGFIFIMLSCILKKKGNFIKKK